MLLPQMTFFLKYSQSIVHLVEKFNSFCRFSELKPNLTQCKIAGTGALKRAQLGSKCIIYVMKLLKIQILTSYNNTIKQESNFLKIVSNVQTVLELWRFRNLTLEGRIVIFKSLAISKIVFQALIAPVPSHIIKSLGTIQTFFRAIHKVCMQGRGEGGVTKSVHPLFW